MVKISVITPVYNVEMFLRETLESLQAQTLKEIEVILVDDGSTDGSPQIIKEFCERNDNFHSIRQENSGVAAARNRGLQEAKGEYVAFLDGDDLYTPETLEAYYTTAKERDAELVIGRICKFDSSSVYYFPNPMVLSCQKKIDPFDPLLTWNFLLGHKLYLRSRIEELGLQFQPLGYAEDAVFYTGFLYHCTRVAGCPKGMMRYRKRAFWETKSITQSVDRQLLEDFFTSHRLIYEDAEKCWDARIARARRKSGLRLRKEAFLGELNYKELFVLVDHFYRFFWRLDQETLDAVSERFDTLFALLSPMNRTRLRKSFGVFNFNRMVMNRTVMAQRPELTAVVDLRAREELERTLQAVYAQNYPSFEVLVPEVCRAMVPQVYQEQENFHFMEGQGVHDALKESSAPYLMYIDRPILPDIRAFGYMTMTLRKSWGDVDVLCAGMGSLAGGVPVPYRFSSLKTEESEPFLCNKIWKTRVLENLPKKEEVLPWAFRETRVDYMEDTLIYTEWPESVLLSELPPSVRQAVSSVQAETENEQEPSRHEVEKKVRRNHMRRMVLWLFSRSEKLNRMIFTISNLFGMRLTQKYDPKPGDGIKVSRLDFYLRRMAIRTVQLLLYFVPLKKRVFFYSIRSNGELLDNAQMVYEQVKGKKVVFAHKLPHRKKSKLLIYYYLLTSKVIVLDDYNRYLRTIKLKKRQRVVQLWHACGAFKKFGLDAPSMLTPEKERATHDQYDAVLVSAPSVSFAYESAFGIAPEIIRPLGVPRTDLLCNEENLTALRSKMLEDYPVLRGKKVILFCPTFREVGGRQVTYHSRINWQRMDESLQEDELFVVCRHPIMKHELLTEETAQTLNHVVDLTDASTLGLMVCASVMVTDYSSVIFESALLRQPVVLYCPDFKRYERDFYLDFKKDLPFPMCQHSDELIEEVRKALRHPDLRAIHSFYEKNMSSCDGHSTRRAAALVQAYLEE